jgi:hypothetical protein
LLKNIHSQIYKSEKMLSEPKEQIPEGILKSEDIPDTYVRVECQCWDTDEEDSSMPLEIRSNTFRPLKEALGQ